MQNPFYDEFCSQVDYNRRTNYMAYTEKEQFGERMNRNLQGTKLQINTQEREVLDRIENEKNLEQEALDNDFKLMCDRNKNQQKTNSKKATSFTNTPKNQLDANHKPQGQKLEGENVFMPKKTSPNHHMFQEHSHDYLRPNRPQGRPNNTSTNVNPAKLNNRAPMMSNNIPSNNVINNQKSECKITFTKQMANTTINSQKLNPIVGLKFDLPPVYRNPPVAANKRAKKSGRNAIAPRMTSQMSNYSIVEENDELPIAHDEVARTFRERMNISSRGPIGTVDSNYKGEQNSTMNKANIVNDQLAQWHGELKVSREVLHTQFHSSQNNEHLIMLTDKCDSAVEAFVFRFVKRGTNELKEVNNLLYQSSSVKDHLNIKQKYLVVLRDLTVVRDDSGCEMRLFVGLNFNPVG